MKDTFTRDEVYRLLLAMLMFSNANNNQGLKAISSEPISFGNVTQHLLNIADGIDLNSNKSVLSTLQQIRIK